MRTTRRVFLDDDTGSFEHKLTLCCSHLTLKFAFLLCRRRFIIFRVRIGEGMISRSSAI
jgi:hypothetical protein